MADRVKYFFLGVLFLVVAGVIAYDRWNSAGVPEEVAMGDLVDSGHEVDFVTPPDSGGTKGALSVDDAGTGGLKEPRDPEEGSRRKVELPPLPEDRRTTPDTGNVIPEPAPVPPAPEPRPAPAPAPKTHVIQKGDTLEKIAVRYYGTRDGIKWIAEANRLDNPNRIFINQKLIIPARKELSPPNPARETATSQPKSQPKPSGKIPSRYVVKEGDGDLYAICRRFYGSEGQGARVASVMETNHLWSADVKPGTVLILPQR